MIGQSSLQRELFQMKMAAGKHPATIVSMTDSISSNR